MGIGFDKAFFHRASQTGLHKSLQKMSKRDLVIKCDHLNKTLQRREEGGGQSQTHKLPLPEWTPPAAAHTFAHIPLLCRCRCVCEPSSLQLTSCFIFMGTSTPQFKRKVEGRWLRRAAPPSHFCLSWTPTSRRCPTLSVLWAQCSVSCALVCGCRRPMRWHTGLTPCPLSVSGSAEGQQGKVLLSALESESYVSELADNLFSSLHKNVAPVTWWTWGQSWASSPPTSSWPSSSRYVCSASPLVTGDEGKATPKMVITD